LLLYTQIINRRHVDRGPMMTVK